MHYGLTFLADAVCVPPPSRLNLGTHPASLALLPHERFPVIVISLGIRFNADFALTLVEIQLNLD